MLQGDRKSYIMTRLQFKIHQFVLGLLIKEATLVIYSALEEDEQYLKYF
jgi:hypothetical protein